MTIVKRALILSANFFRELLDILSFTGVVLLAQFSGLLAFIAVKIDLGGGAIPIVPFTISLAFIPMCYAIGNKIANFTDFRFGDPSTVKLELWRRWFDLAARHPDAAIDRIPEDTSTLRDLQRAYNRLAEAAGEPTIPVDQPRRTWWPIVVMVALIGTFIAWMATVRWQ